MNEQPQFPVRVDNGRWLAVQNIRHGLKPHGPMEGKPAVFIDMAGCHLACTWCNVDYTSSVHEQRQQLHIDDILEAVSNHARHGTTLVVISGGEPCRQNIAPLMQALLEDVSTPINHVVVETSGMIAPQGGDILFDDGFPLDKRFVTFVVSPKLSRVDPWFYKRADHWLYVAAAGDVHPADGLPYKRTQRQAVVIARTAAERANSDFDSPAIMRPPSARKVTVWLRPVEDVIGNVSTADLKAVVESCTSRGYRLALPAHLTALDAVNSLKK